MKPPLLAAMVAGAGRSLEQAREISAPDTRVLMVRWIGDHVPTGTRIASDAWLHLPLTLPCLEQMREQALRNEQEQARARRRDANAAAAAESGDVQDYVDKLRGDAVETRSPGLLRRPHLEARIAAARRSPPEPAYDLQLLLPIHLHPRTPGLLLDHGVHYLVIASNRWNRVLRSAERAPEWAAFYRRLLEGPHILHRVEPAPGAASGPTLLLCDLRLLAPDDEGG